MSPWVDGLTFAEVLAKTVADHAAADALVFPQLGFRRNYSQFQASVNSCARAIIALGIRPGEHIGIWATNLPQWVIVQFAAACAGAVLVNINPAYRAHELEYVLNQADITTLFLTDQFKNTDYFGILENVCPELTNSLPGELHSAKCPKLRNVISIKETARPGMRSWPQFLDRTKAASAAELAARQKALRPEDVVNIQYTSGNTGFPKRAMLSHRNLLMNPFHVGGRLPFTSQDRLCIPVPFYHCFGCVMGTLMCAVYGSAMVVPAESFDPLATLQAIQAEHFTAIYVVPTTVLA